MKPKFSITLVLVILCICLLTACGDSTATTTTTQATTAAGAGTTTTTAAGTSGGATTAAATGTTASSTQAAATTAASGQAATTTGATGEAPKGILTMPGNANNSTIRNFNPFSPAAQAPTNKGIYEPLMIFNTIKGQIVPWLATEYKWSADAKTLTFTLRDGVKWSDGQPFTAKDVVFTFNLLRDKPGLQGAALQAMSAQTGYIDSVTAPDDKTVVFALKRPYSPAIYDIINQDIVPEHSWKDIADPVKATNENPVGTGPFTQVVSFTAQQYEVDRNPNYWQSGKPAIQGLKYILGLVGEAGTLAVANGNFDWTGGNIPNIDQVYVAKDPQNRGYWSPLTGYTATLNLLTTKKPFDDPNVRKAISYAINRQQIATVGMSNSTKGSDVTGLSDGYPQFKVADPSKLGDWTTYNVAKANQLLDAAGLKKGANGLRTMPDGSAMKFEIQTIQGFSDFARSVDIIVQNLKAVGLDVSAKPVDFGAWLDASQKGNFDMIVGFSGGATPYNAYQGAMSQFTTAPVGQPAYGGNFGRFVDPKADELLAQWAATADAEKQKATAAQLQQLFADNAPFLPLFPQPQWEIYKTTNFTGFPTKDNPYAVGTPAGSAAGGAEQLIVLTTIKPR